MYCKTFKNRTGSLKVSNKRKKQSKCTFFICFYDT